MRLYQVGKCVEIDGRLIPALNIQVDEAFRYIDDEWYGLYFEVMFEDGDLWEVDQDYESCTVRVVANLDWAAVGPPLGTKETVMFEVIDWAHFLEIYDVKTPSKYPLTWRRLLDPCMDGNE